MNKPWPPPAPAFGKDFKSAHDAEKKEAAAPAPPAEGGAAKTDLDQLQNQVRAGGHRPVLVPPGMKQTYNDDQRRAARLAQMQQKLRAKDQGKSQDHGHSASM